MNKGRLAIILAAGEGTRMRSDLPKVLHPIASRPMIHHVVAACREAGFDHVACVVGAKAGLVRTSVAKFDPAVSFHEQAERKGTGHAVQCAKSAIERGYAQIVVLNGDGPLLRAETVRSLADEVAATRGVAVLGFDTDEPTGYGRMIVEDGTLVGIVEEKDADAKEREIGFVNSGMIAIDGLHAWSWLDRIDNDNEQREYYLPDVVKTARADGARVTCPKVDELETLGVNDRVQLADVERKWQSRRRIELMRAGVSMQAPETVWLAADTQIGREVTLEPNVWFGPGVRVADGARIRANSHLEGCRIGEACEVGPFARIRPGTVLERTVKVGNFVEVKNTNVAEGAKLNHLSYLGDASIGASANIGAGTITCNYDGFLKHHTTIGRDAFIGSNSALVAPVAIGERANVAAGSVVVDDVQSDALVLARGRQVEKPGRAKAMRAHLAAAKAAAKQN